MEEVDARGLPGLLKALFANYRDGGKLHPDGPLPPARQYHAHLASRTLQPIRGRRPFRLVRQSGYPLLSMWADGRVLDIDGGEDR